MIGTWLIFGFIVRHVPIFRTMCFHLRKVLRVGGHINIVKDSVVNAICYGAKLMIPGLLRFENDIDVGEEVVLMTTKGEDISLGIVEMTIVVIGL